MPAATGLAHLRLTSVTYRVAVRVPALLGAALVAAVLSATAGGSTPRTAELRLDGATIRPELALTSAERSLGLMHRKRAPADGMLFVFPEPTGGGFWMKNTLVPLRIVFFDSAGRRVRGFRMTPCRKDPCRIYAPGRRYRFALELPTTDTRPATRLGPLADLRRLSELAS